ncbi:beta-N-acetylhexosaminidase [Urechidicola sp. KH5]
MKLFKVITGIGLGLVLSSCGGDKLPVSDLAKAALIPIPNKIEATHKNFVLNADVVIQSSDDASFKDAANFLVEKIAMKTQLTPNVVSNGGAKKGIYLNQVNDAAAHPESYELIISQDSIVINAPTGVGAFRAMQTIRQVIPFNSVDNLNTEWLIPTGQIQDSPNFDHRGSMLDVSRHFFTVEDVKKYIDIMAYYKMNILHFHLSDDQGWRLEIKKWPLLTEIGGHTEVGGEEGGFFTQEDYKEIVAYATKHHITIIPEIDMPGHTHAASTAYPFLNGSKKTAEMLDTHGDNRKAALYTGIEVGFSTFDTRNEKVYEFVDDVIKEIAELTPGPYIHMGGDESLVTEKDDYIYFVNRVEKIIQKYGKTMIGWDEIANADVSSESVVQFWAEEENVKLAQEKEMKVILSPAKKIYLDMQYDSLSKHGLHWAAYIPVDSSYTWNPETYVHGLPKEQILGVEAPLWSETISNMQEIEYLAFPRLLSAAELGWSAPTDFSWKTYKVRLANQTSYFKKMNIQYYQSDRVDWAPVE